MSWHLNAVIYALDVKTFSDSNGDGIGDFQGLISRLDYLADLGVTCVWLLPFYPSPWRDDGYDVADYMRVDPRLGTLEDFTTFTREARARGIRVIIDLVVNHTSTDHPWFQAARRNPASPFRDYYIWTETPPAEERRGGPVFPGEQYGNWAYDEVARAHYWHWFYGHQPDLNTGNPAVRDEIKSVIGFWLAHGISGFRLDAAPFLFKRKGLSGSHPDDPIAFLLELREFLLRESNDAIFLAEADVSTDELTFFLGEGERMHLLLNFILNNHFFLALAREQREPLNRAFAALPARPASSQWANFVRNHDELNLDRLPQEERDFVFARFAPDPRMRIYGRGIRRRLPSMLGGSRPWIDLVYALLTSLPGVPVLRYGEEIGMGEDLSLEGRFSVRTPMQWSDAPNAGFSSAPRHRLIRPPIDEGRYRYKRVNVASQLKDPTSLLAHVRRLVEQRRACPEIGLGVFEALESGSPHVFAHCCRTERATFIGIHNLSRDRQLVRLEMTEDERRGFEDLLGSAAYPSFATHPHFEIEGHGYRWLRSESSKA